jgi:hypothetical protein
MRSTGESEKSNVLVVIDDLRRTHFLGSNFRDNKSLGGAQRDGSVDQLFLTV